MFIFSVFLFSETPAEYPANYYDEDAGEESNPYQIANLGNLRWLSETEEFFVINWSDKRYIYCEQTSDIDATETVEWHDGKGFIPIGAIGGGFLGNYNGNNYKITGLYIRPNVYNVEYYGGYTVGNLEIYLGLFERIIDFDSNSNSNTPSRVLNTHLQNIDYSLEGFLLNNIISPRLSVYVVAGGIVASARWAAIDNCSTSGIISVVDSIEIEGDIEVYHSFTVGGLVGAANGIALRRSSSRVSIISELNSSSAYIGGLIGKGVSNISNSYFYGDISSGYSGVYNQCGGIFGRMAYFPLNITNCYVASRNGFTNTAGVFGLMSREVNIFPLDFVVISGTFWDITTTNTEDAYWYSENENFLVPEYMGLTTEQMKTGSTYEEAGWDFEEVWAISPDYNDGYPYLRSALPPPNMVSDFTNKDTVEPLRTQLMSNYPNPFNPSTTISYTVGNAFMRSESAENTGEAVRISVYNIKGQLVKTLVNEYKEAGQHKVVWNGESEQGIKASSGVYFYRMETKTGSEVKKMLLLK
jgi:hypothetical protein